MFCWEIYAQIARLILLKKFVMKNVSERVSELLRFQNFLEGRPPVPPSEILPGLWQRSGYGPGQGNLSETWEIIATFNKPKQSGLTCQLGHLERNFVKQIDREQL